MASTGSSSRRRALFVALALLLAALVLEGLLQLCCLALPPIDAVIGRGVPPTVDDPVLQYRPNPAFPDHDAAGFRNAVRPERADIVALGDSQTYGHAVTRESAWPARLQAATGLSVYNMAYSGYGTGHCLALLDEALALQPRLVVVGLYGGNDLIDTFFMVHDRGQLPALRSADPDIASAIAEARDSGRSLTAAWKATQEAWRWSGPGAVPRQMVAWLADNSRLVGVGRALARASSESLGAAAPSLPWEEVRARADAAEDSLLFAVEVGELRTVLTPQTRLSVVDLDDARVVEGLRLALAALGEIQARVPLLVVFIPTKEWVVADAVAASDLVPPESYEALVRHEEALWRRVADGLTSAGIAWIDGLPGLKRRVLAGDFPYRIDLDGHPNDSGNAALAEVVGGAAAVRALMSPR